jgi:hypothetical protein
MKTSFLRTIAFVSLLSSSIISIPSLLFAGKRNKKDEDKTHLSVQDVNKLAAQHPDEYIVQFPAPSISASIEQRSFINGTVEHPSVTASFDQQYKQAEEVAAKARQDLRNAAKTDEDRAIADIYEAAGEEIRRKYSGCVLRNGEVPPSIEQDFNDILQKKLQKMEAEKKKRVAELEKMQKAEKLRQEQMRQQEEAQREEEERRQVAEREAAMRAAQEAQRREEENRRAAALKEAREEAEYQEEMRREEAEEAAENQRRRRYLQRKRELEESEMYRDETFQESFDDNCSYDEDYDEERQRAAQYRRMQMERERERERNRIAYLQRQREVAEREKKQRIQLLDQVTEVLSIPYELRTYEHERFLRAHRELVDHIERNCPARQAYIVQSEAANRQAAIEQQKREFHFLEQILATPEEKRSVDEKIFIAFNKYKYADIFDRRKEVIKKILELSPAQRSVEDKQFLKKNEWLKKEVEQEEERKKQRALEEEKQRKQRELYWQKHEEKFAGDSNGAFLIQQGREYEEQRKNGEKLAAIKQTLDQPEKTETTTIQIQDSLASHQNVVQMLKQCTGTPIQQFYHKKLVSYLTDTRDLYKTEVDDRWLVNENMHIKNLDEVITQYLEIANHFNNQNQLEVVSELSDFCNHLYWLERYCASFLKQDIVATGRSFIYPFQKLFNVDVTQDNIADFREKIFASLSRTYNDSSTIKAYIGHASDSLKKSLITRLSKSESLRNRLLQDAPAIMIHLNAKDSQGYLQAAQFVTDLFSVDLPAEAQQRFRATIQDKINVESAICGNAQDIRADNIHVFRPIGTIFADVLTKAYQEVTVAQAAQQSAQPSAAPQPQAGSAPDYNETDHRDKRVRHEESQSQVGAVSAAPMPFVPETATIIQDSTVMPSIATHRTNPMEMDVVATLVDGQKITPEYLQQVNTNLGNQLDLLRA